MQVKTERNDYNRRFKLAFKTGTDLVHQRLYGDNRPSKFCSVDAIVLDLNEQFQLNGWKKLSKITLYRAVRRGHAGASPLKRGPAPRIPDLLMDIVVTHTEVSQVGDGGVLRGRDIERLINAAVMEVESVQKKVVILTKIKKQQSLQWRTLDQSGPL